MKKSLKYLILPAIQAVIAALLIISDYLKVLPKRISAYTALGIVLFGMALILILRLATILFASWIINISKIIYYKLKKEELISICVWPVYAYKEKITLANVFWVYDDRTCFSMSKYLKDKKSYGELKEFILGRNRILAFIYIVCSTVFFLICMFNQWYTVGAVYIIGAIEHFLYQCEYRTIESAYGMAFAGLKKVDNKLLLHMLVNQSKVESLGIGRDVAEILSEDMYDRDGGYFFNYLCLSGMFREISEKTPGKCENSLLKYMEQKVEDIIDDNEKAHNLVKYKNKESIYKNVKDDVCVFYDNYREFLLYVLMYYKIKGCDEKYKRLSNYIAHMLEKVEAEYINESILSNAILSDKFYTYKNLYLDVLEKRFLPEKTIFSGYDTLPVWKEQRELFIEKFHSV